MRAEYKGVKSNPFIIIFIKTLNDIPNWLFQLLEYSQRFDVNTEDLSFRGDSLLSYVVPYGF